MYTVIYAFLVILGAFVAGDWLSRHGMPDKRYLGLMKRYSNKIYSKLSRFLRLRQ